MSISNLNAPKRLGRPRGRRTWIGLLALALAPAAAMPACGDGEIEIALTPNRYLVLPFATAEIKAGRLRLAATGLWPLAAGRRYLCWLTKAKTAGPPKYIGELKSGLLVVDEAAIGGKFADYSGLSCTVESTASPAQPSSTEALRGEPGGLLYFGAESLTTSLAAASGSCRIDGLRAVYDYAGLPALPAGFRYGFYLRGVLLDPNSSLGVSSTHQHLTSSGGSTSSSPATSERTILLRWLDRLPDGAGEFWERSGGNLTGHRKALVSIEAKDGDGTQTLFPLAGPAGAAAVSHGTSGSPTQTAGAYEVKLEVDSTDIHVGDVVTFTFRVTEKDSPVSGLVPSASYQDPTGKPGSITLAPGTAAGTYTGTKAFFVAGQYRIELKFNQSGKDYATSFDITVKQH